MINNPRTVSKLIKEYFDRIYQLQRQLDRRLEKCTSPERRKDAMRFVRAETNRSLRRGKK